MPGVLIAVIGATVLVGTLRLDARGVSVLGSLPQGLPAFAIPSITPADVLPILMGGFAVAIVSFADTSVLSRTYAEKTASHVDANQEMVVLGAANLAAGFFQGFPISSSPSRTPVAGAAGARTQLTSVVGAVAVALLLLLAPGLGRTRSRQGHQWLPRHLTLPGGPPDSRPGPVSLDGATLFCQCQVVSR